MSSTSRFPVSDRVAPELAKSSDVWSVFSPLAGHVPKDALNLGQVSLPFPSLTLSPQPQNVETFVVLGFYELGTSRLYPRSSC